MLATGALDAVVRTVDGTLHERFMRHITIITLLKVNLCTEGIRYVNYQTVLVKPGSVNCSHQESHIRDPFI